MSLLRCYSTFQTYSSTFKGIYYALKEEKQKQVLSRRSEGYWHLKIVKYFTKIGKGIRHVLIINAITPSLFCLQKVGLVAFSSYTATPSGCFGSIVAKGIPANLERLRGWLENVYALGRTYALIHMLTLSSVRRRFSDDFFYFYQLNLRESKFYTLHFPAGN